ncbi:MAG: class I SAM-dependent methyltransferase [Caldilineaceae bacterium]
MSQVNYNEISRIYDQVRQADVELINHFVQEVAITRATRILDLGCGTANHTDLLQRVTHAQLYGVDPSEGMLSKARQKNSQIVFQPGNAEQIPFADGFFDFVYMTDVIHHVPDIGKMFVEIARVLVPGGKLCIVTQSHQQIERRPIVHFFPGTATVDKARYPDIPQIIAAAARAGLRSLKNSLLAEGEELTLDASFLELVQKKGYSMLHLICDDEYRQGLRKLEAVLRDGPIQSTAAGMTLVWLVK